MKLESLPSNVKTGPRAAMLTSLDVWLRGILKDNVGKPVGKLSGVHATGHPPAAAGQWYFAWHPVNLGGQSSQADYVDNVMTLACTLSVISTVVPRDRQKDGVLCGEAQAIDVADWLATENGPHGRYEPICTYANTLIGGTAETKQGIVEPLFFQIQRLEEKGPDWWRALGRGESAGLYGFAIETRFQGGRYIRGVVR